MLCLSATPRHLSLLFPLEFFHSLLTSHSRYTLSPSDPARAFLLPRRSGVQGSLPARRAVGLPDDRGQAPHLLSAPQHQAPGSPAAPRPHAAATAPVCAAWGVAAVFHCALWDEGDTTSFSTHLLELMYYAFFHQIDWALPACGVLSRLALSRCALIFICPILHSALPLFPFGSSTHGELLAARPHKEPALAVV